MTNGNNSTLIIKRCTLEAIAILRGVIDFYEAECLLYKINQISRLKCADENDIEQAHRHFRNIINYLMMIAETLFKYNENSPYYIAFDDTRFYGNTDEDLYYEIKWGLSEMMDALNAFDIMPYYMRTPEKDQEYKDALAEAESEVENIIGKLRELLMVSLTA